MAGSAYSLKNAVESSFLSVYNLTHSMYSLLPVARGVTTRSNGTDSWNPAMNVAASSISSAILSSLDKKVNLLLDLMGVP